jgi:HD-GYP domain-containing protein (c-di-GMP phosphodiesterase class II)
LHDIGKIGIPDAILNKPGKLSDEEWVIMKKHPDIGYKILHKIKFLEGASQIVLHHHEKFDGTGYPDQLKGENIPLGARIFAVADTVDAMTSERPYRHALTFEIAAEELIKFNNIQFDPIVVEAFHSINLDFWKNERLLADRKFENPDFF